MPKTKEQKRVEATERVLRTQLKSMLRGIYGYTPYGAVFQYWVEENSADEVAALRINMNNSLVDYVRMLQDSQLCRDYFYSVIGKYVVGRFNRDDVYELVTHPKMIEWSYRNECFVPIDDLPLDTLEVVQANLKRFFEEFEAWWAPHAAVLKEMENNSKGRNGT